MRAVVFLVEIMKILSAFWGMNERKLKEMPPIPIKQNLKL
jgi:hypothetical protein